MARRALVVGSQTYGLKGVLADAQRVRTVLAARGFEVDHRAGPSATREGILEGYQRLIESCSEGDSAVFYFSGHGGRVKDLEARPDGHPRFSSHEQFIVPEDFQASREGDFRGITALELSALQAQLAATTRDVTVILDCCYASGMSRSPGVRAKGLADVSYRWIAAHLEHLRTQGCLLGSPHRDGNPHAVRLAAAGMDEAAFEYLTERGDWAGVMTDALLTALEEAGQLPVSWELIGRRVRERVIAALAFQRPEIEGPIQRIAFGPGESAATPGLPYFAEGGRHYLRGGRLHGVCVGDEYLLMPFPALAADPGRGLARAHVVQVDSGTCEISLTVSEVQASIAPGSPAFLMRAARPRRGVHLIDEGADESLALALRSRLEASTLVRPTSEGERAPFLATITLGGASIELRDRDGYRVAYPRRPERGVVGSLALEVEALARAQALRELESGTGANTLGGEFCVEWGVVERGAPRRLSGQRTPLRPGERVYVRLVNDGKERLYASIFDIGLAGRITLLNRWQPSGLLVEPRGDGWLGMRQERELVGIELHWPGVVPPEAPGIESFVVIISSQPQDLRVLESSGAQPRADTPSPRSQLQALLEHLAWGGARDLTLLRERPPVPYAVRHLDFLLEAPKPPATS